MSTPTTKQSRGPASGSALVKCAAALRYITMDHGLGATLVIIDGEAKTVDGLLDTAEAEIANLNLRVTGDMVAAAVGDLNTPFDCDVIASKLTAALNTKALPEGGANH